MRVGSLRTNESGMVLVAALLAVMLATSVMAGMFAAINADQRSQGVDRDQTQVYAAAHAGLEKLTSDLVSLFVTDVSPSVEEINELATFPPEIPGFEYRAPGGVEGSGYAVAFTPDADGNPQVLANADITAGPYQGFKGLITPFSVTVTARSAGGSEVRLRRDLQTVAVPVFQFGVFSETDLTFYAGDNFDFGGRVHTNGNLFPSQLTGYTLKFTDRITALGHVVRSHLSNGRAVSDVYFTGTVNVPTAVGSPGTYRNLKYTGPNEGSILGFPGATPPPLPNENWTSISVGTYKSNIRTGLTGAKRLDLPLVSQGATPIDLIKRPADADEDTDAPLVFGQRYFSLASLRILLSDRATDITDLPTTTATAPVALDGNWNTTPPAAYGPVDATHPPIARSFGPFSTTTHASTNSTYSSSLATIMLAATSVPAELRIPLLTVGALTNVDCKAVTATQLLGCTLTSSVPSGTTVSATIAGVTVSRTTSSSSASGTNATMTLTGGPAVFLPSLFGHLWANDTTGARPIACTGYDNNSTTSPKRLTGCSGLSGAPATGSLVSTHAHVPAGTGLIGGFIKIESQDAAGTWTDVTAEILNLGIGAANQAGALCADPTPNAVLRIQRLRDNGGGTCTYASSTNSTDWWPNALYDAREGNYRDVSTTTLMEMGGVMQYIALDVNNLKRWLNGTIGTTGTTTWNQNGFIVYFSDRRGNHDWTDPGGVDDPETGEYGWEDVVNPASSTGTPNGTLQTGEDVNGDGVLQVYGATPQALVISAGATDPFTTPATCPTATKACPTTNISAGQASVNRTVLFRRALKVINGGIVGGVNNLPDAGLTIVAENPVYVQGNYNATTSPTAEPNRAAAIMADAVSVLSNNWTDARSFRFPNDRNSRPATITAYRFAVLAGKNPSFPYPTAGSPQFLFGTDGGVGNFLRLLENWNLSGVSINYRGSIVSLYYSRQATGTFRFSPNVYSYGDRNFTFDTDFLQPALLPPGTPMFRDVNTLTFRQILRPNQ